MYLAVGVLLKYVGREQPDYSSCAETRVSPTVLGAQLQRSLGKITIIRKLWASLRSGKRLKSSSPGFVFHVEPCLPPPPPCSLPAPSHLRLLVAFGWGDGSGEDPCSGRRRATHLASQAEGPEAFPTWKSAPPAHLVFLKTPAVPHSVAIKEPRAAEEGSQGVLQPAQTPWAREGVGVSHTADGSSSSPSTGLPPSHSLQTSTAASPLQANPRSCVRTAQHHLAEHQPHSLNCQPKNLPLQTHHCYLFYYPALHNLYFFFYYLDWSPEKVYVPTLDTLQFLILTVRKLGLLFFLPFFFLYQCFLWFFIELLQWYSVKIKYFAFNLISPTFFPIYPKLKCNPLRNISSNYTSAAV